MATLGISMTSSAPIVSWNENTPAPKESQRLAEARHNMISAQEEFDALDDIEGAQFSHSFILAAASRMREAEQLFWKIWDEENKGEGQDD